MTLKITVDSGGALGALDSFTGGLTGLAGSITDVFSGIISTITDIGSKFADLAIDFGQESVASFSEYEDMLALVSKTTQFTGDQLQELGNQARDLAKPIGDLTAIDLLSVAKNAGQLGIVAGKSFEEAKDIIASFSVSIGKGAIALDSFSGNTDKLSSAVAKTQNIFGLATDSTDALLSLWSKLSTSTAANEVAIANFMQRMVKGQSVLKLTAAEAGALAGVFQNSNIQVESASRLFSSAAANIAKGGQYIDSAAALVTNSLDEGAQAISRLEQITGRTGTTLVQLPALIQQAFGTDALETMTILSETFVSTANQSENIQKAVQASGLAIETFGKPAIAVIESLGQASLRSGDDVKSLEYIMNTANEAFAAANEHLSAYERQTAKFGQATKEFGSVINDIQITVGGPLLEAFSAFYKETLTPIVNEFATWLRESALIKEILPSMLADASALLGDLVIMAVEFTKSVDWDPIFQALQAGFSRAIELLREMLQSAVDFAKTIDWSTVLEKGITLWNNISTMIVSATTSAWEFAKSIDWAQTLTTAKALWTDISAAAQELFQRVREIWPEMSSGVTSVSAVIPSLVQGFGDVATTLADLWELGETLWNGLSAGIEHVQTVTQPVFQLIFEAFSALTDETWSFGEAFGRVFDSLKSSIGATMDMIGGLLGKIRDLIPGLKEVNDVGDTQQAMQGAIERNNELFSEQADEIQKVTAAGKELGDEMMYNSVLPDITAGTIEATDKIVEYGKSMAGLTGHLDSIYQTGTNTFSNLKKDVKTYHQEFERGNAKASSSQEAVQFNLYQTADAIQSVGSAFSQMGNNAAYAGSQAAQAIAAKAAQAIQIPNTSAQFVENAMSGNAASIAAIMKGGGRLPNIGGAGFSPSPYQTSHQPIAPVSTQQAPVQHYTTNVTFQGQNIVDQSSQNRFANNMSKLQRSQAAKTISTR